MPDFHAEVLRSSVDGDVVFLEVHWTGTKADGTPLELVQRWILGTHQGAISHHQLDYYLDEFTFRFNRRRSHHRGLLFYRLLQGAVAADPHPYKALTSKSAA